MAKYCINCGKELKKDADVCLNCGKLVDKNDKVLPTTKSKIAAGLFGIFLGCFGVHNFYLGYIAKALTQLLLTVFSCFLLSPIIAIWGLIEGILILCGVIDKDSQGHKLSD